MLEEYCDLLVEKYEGGNKSPECDKKLEVLHESMEEAFPEAKNEPESIEICTYGTIHEKSEMIFTVRLEWLFPLIQMYGFSSIEEFQNTYEYDLAQEILNQAEREAEVLDTNEQD